MLEETDQVDTGHESQLVQPMVVPNRLRRFRSLLSPAGSISPERVQNEAIPLVYDPVMECRQSAVGAGDEPHRASA
jgi:hypothetical protein